MSGIEPYTRMSGIRMIVPVVMIGNIQSICCFFAQTKQITFSVIPEVIVRECNISRFFTVQCTVTLGLVGIAAS